MAKSARGRHDDTENQSGGFVGSDPSDEDSNTAAASNGGGDGAAPSDNSASVTKGRTEAEKAAAFSRLASIRASNALDAMRGISHLANAKQYAFTREQVDKMLGALSDSIDALRKGFEVALAQAEAEASSTDGAPAGRKKRGARQNFSIRV